MEPTSYRMKIHTKNYKEDPTPSLAARITKYIKELYTAGHINETELHHILPINLTKTPVMYFLLKIHKTPHQLRPIVTGINGPTANLSNFLDYFFKPLLTTPISSTLYSKKITSHSTATTNRYPGSPWVPPLPPYLCQFLHEQL